MGKTFTIVVQKWEESERGWGTRPDGWTMHLNVEAHMKYMADFNTERKVEYERTKVVPDEYSRPDGTAYPMDVDEETYKRIQASPNQTIWGQGNSPPKGQQGPNGWRSSND